MIGVSRCRGGRCSTTVVSDCYTRVGCRKTIVRRERWLLSRDGRHVNIHRMLLLPIAVTQILFAYLAVDRLAPIKFCDHPLHQRG